MDARLATVNRTHRSAMLAARKRNAEELEKMMANFKEARSKIEEINQV